MTPLKSGYMSNMKVQEAFEVVGLEVPCEFILQNGSRYDLRTGIPNNSLEVYKSGFPYLGLKPGAEEFLKKEKVADVVAMIKRAGRVQDVEVLLKVKPDSPQVQAAAEERIKQFVV